MASPTAVAPATDCSEPCTGNASETCGASLRVWVFTVDSIPPPPPSPPPVPPPALPMADPRYIPTGRVIVTGGYACQPYCVTARVAPDSATLADSGIGGDTDQPTPAQPTEGSNQNLTWTCVMTYNALDYVEGTPGEHMISTRSSDQGKTWSPFVSLEPYSAVSTDQVSAYGSIGARADGSRLVAYWIQNTNNVSHVPDKPASASFRADMLGEFVWKYSDDGGISWSDQHYVIPVPKRFIDRGNTWNGTVQIMWQVDHMKTTQNGSAMFAFTKVGVSARCVGLLSFMPHPCCPHCQPLHTRTDSAVVCADLDTPSTTIWGGRPSNPNGVIIVSSGVVVTALTRRALACAF